MQDVAASWATPGVPGPLCFAHTRMDLDILLSKKISFFWRFSSRVVFCCRPISGFIPEPEFSCSAFLLVIVFYLFFGIVTSLIRHWDFTSATVAYSLAIVEMVKVPRTDATSYRV